MSESTLPIQGTAPSEVLLKYPELHQANTAAPPPPKPLSWWQALFAPEWSEAEFVQIVTFTYRYIGTTDWATAKGSLYRQANRRTGQYRYWVRAGHGDQPVDAGAWETAQTLIFT